MRVQLVVKHDFFYRERKRDKFMLLLCTSQNCFEFRLFADISVVYRKLQAGAGLVHCQLPNQISFYLLI